MFHSKIRRFWQDDHLVIIITVVSYIIIQECLLGSALRLASFKQNGLEGMEERDEVTNRCMMKCGKKFRTNDREGTALFDGSPRAEDKKFSLHARLSGENSFHLFQLLLTRQIFDSGSRP